MQDCFYAAVLPFPCVFHSNRVHVSDLWGRKKERKGNRYTQKPKPAQHYDLPFVFLNGGNTCQQEESIAQEKSVQTGIKGGRGVL